MRLSAAANLRMQYS